MSNYEPAPQSLFAHGADALARARPDLPSGLYGCPICLMAYNTPDAFTQEHVPPKSVGGRPLLLTCAACNSIAGSELDFHIAAASAAAQLAAGQGSITTRMTLEGHTITATLQLRDGSLDFVADPSRSNPTDYEAFLRALSATDQQSFDRTFRLRYRDPHDPWRESVAWLRVGYLYAFALLGYNYILQPSLTLIREQIRSPDQKIVPYLIKRTSHNEMGSLRFVWSPEKFRCILVVLNDRAIVLPDFEHPSTLKARLSSLALEEWPTTFKGPGVSLPSRPQYLADLNLQAVLRQYLPRHSDSDLAS